MTIRDRKEGGASRLVKVITDTDLKENGGRYTVSGKIATPVIVDEDGLRKITGGPISHAVYVVSEDQIIAGDYRVGGGSGLVVVDSTSIVPPRSSAAGFQATPVYVVSGSLGGVATDETGASLAFDDGSPYLFSALPTLPELSAVDASPAEDFLHMWDTADGKAKKILIKDYGAAISRIQYAYFRMYRSTNWNISDNVWFEFDWNATLYDSHSGVNLGTNRYTIPTGQGGLWWFHASIALAPWAYTRVRFYVNGTARFWASDTRATQNAPEAQDNTEAVFFWNCDEGDYIRIYSYHHQSQDVIAGNVHSYFEGMKIGPQTP